MANEEWFFKPRLYPHFDHPIFKKSEAEELVTNIQKVASHAFLPFLEYKIENRKFTKYLEQMHRLELGEDVSDFNVNKSRSIKYAAHKDAQIFSYYRFLLSKEYEQRLYQLNLNDNVIAYRRIPVPHESTKNKCNIHFAKESFDEIVRRRNITAITLDISKFFDSLDHCFLQKKWCELLTQDELPQDHMAVFKAITNYSVVNCEDCYEKLGLIEINNGKRSFLYNPTDRTKHKKMLCSKEEYRNLIVGTGLVKKNEYSGNLIPQGIPQGSPISDILANLYMIDFDLEMKKLEVQYNAYYKRYSDDILWICPTEYADVIEQTTKDIMLLQGQKTLKINNNKTTKTSFIENGKTLTYIGDKFNYLGFTFDGEKALYRDATISNYRREAISIIESFVKKAHIKGIGNEKKNIKGNGRSLKDNLNVSQLFHKIGYINKKYIAAQKYKNSKLPSAHHGRIESNFMNYHLRALSIFNKNYNFKYKLSNQQLINYKKQFKKKIIDISQKFDPNFNLN